MKKYGEDKYFIIYSNIWKKTEASYFNCLLIKLFFNNITMLFLEFKKSDLVIEHPAQLQGFNQHKLTDKKFWSGETIFTSLNIIFHKPFFVGLCLLNQPFGNIFIQ
jgi:hypothetical protein